MSLEMETTHADSPKAGANEAMTYELVCEGACNNYATAILDMEVDRAFRERINGGGDGVTGNQALWTEQRKLKHTPHIILDPIDAKCMACGRVRKFATAPSEQKPEQEEATDGNRELVGIGC
jgi:hypothetical protein